MPDEMTTDCEFLVLIGFGTWIVFAVALSIATRAWLAAEAKLAEQIAWTNKVREENHK